MDEILQISDLLTSSWKVIITFLLCMLFGSVALMNAWEYLSQKIGLESKNEKRFKALEADLSILKKELTSTEDKLDEQVDIYHTEQDERRGVTQEITTNIYQALNEINRKLEKQEQTDLKKLRHTIVRAGEEAITNGQITVRSLRSIEELYEEYSGMHEPNGQPANGYVKTLMHKVREVTVIGKLDKNNEDIID